MKKVFENADRNNVTGTKNKKILVWDFFVKKYLIVKFKMNISTEVYFSRYIKHYKGRHKHFC